MVTKERLHELVETLPESEWEDAERALLEVRAKYDPILRAILNAPYDDESVTPEEEEAVREAYEAIERGDVISHEELRRRLRA